MKDGYLLKGLGCDGLKFNPTPCCVSHPGCHQVANESKPTEPETNTGPEPSASQDDPNSDQKEEPQEQQEQQRETKTQNPSALEAQAEDQVTC